MGATKSMTSLRPSKSGFRCDGFPFGSKSSMRGFSPFTNSPGPPAGVVVVSFMRWPAAASIEYQSDSFCTVSNRVTRPVKSNGPLVALTLDCEKMRVVIPEEEGGLTASNATKKAGALRTKMSTRRSP